MYAKMGHMTTTMAALGVIYHMYARTKRQYQVLIFTRYGNVKDNAKCTQLNL